MGDPISDKRLTILRKGIELNYKHNWIVDNMPVTWCYQFFENDRQFCTTNFPMGCLTKSVSVNGILMHCQFFLLQIKN